MQPVDFEVNMCGQLRSVIPNRCRVSVRNGGGRRESRAGVRPQSPALFAGEPGEHQCTSPLTPGRPPKPSGRGWGLQFNPHPCPPARVAEGGFDFDFDARQVRMMK